MRVISLAFLVSTASAFWDVQSVLGSLKPGPQTGNVEYTLPTERTFLLNVPEDYEHGVPYPLVFSFHGAGGYSERQQRITELSDSALRIAGKPFLTVYPQGIAYVFDILNTVSDSYSVDLTRVYACGKSNGGGFTALLACRPDTAAVFAAFAPVAPALYQGTFSFYNCTPGRAAVPLLHAHGIEDRITEFHGRTPLGGSFGPEPDVRVWRRQWADRNGCRAVYPGSLPEPNVTETHPGTWEEAWDCPAGAEVRSLSIEGLGHAWPSTKGLDSAGRPNQTANFDFTREHLVQFFSRHHL